MKQLIECVPNFSEGRDMTIIKQITDQIQGVEGVRLLDVDPGAATNRTVVTFVGEPGPVSEAAFRAIHKASELIDMSKHHGAHPRFGATDVCPFIPISNITMYETVEYARKLGERVGNELDIPVYCYENPAWKPDFGPVKFNAFNGAIAIGARDFLVAYNVNLNTTSVRRANAVAFDIREKGRPGRAEERRVGKECRSR